VQVFAQSDGSAVAIETGDEGYGTRAVVPKQSPVEVSDIMVVNCTLQRTDGPAVSFLGRAPATNVLIKGNSCFDNNRIDNTWIQIFTGIGLSESEAESIANATFTTFQLRPHRSSIRFYQNVIPQDLKTSPDDLKRNANNVGIFAAEYFNPADNQWHGFGTSVPVSWMPTPW
jgi:hypothetical protein